MEIKLPTEPVDQYEVAWWIFLITAKQVYIRHQQLVYHMNTPWKDFSDEPHGADLVDDWMVYEDEKKRATGRGPGWKWPEGTNDRRYATKEEVVSEAKKELRKDITFYRSEITECQAALLKLDRP